MGPADTPADTPGPTPGADTRGRHNGGVTATTGPTSERVFRCAAAAPVDPEPMAGSAPADTEWLLVEQPGPWGRQAVAESRLPEPVRAHLAGLDGVRVQLIRRHGGASGPGVRVFSAMLGERPVVRTAVLADPAELLDGPDAIAWEPHDGPLWLVCTNGRRDLCCAELGRPVTAALAARWPEATWETSHLGGHRFSGTLLALPAGVVLGRLDPASAVEACAALEAGRLPAGLARGRAGRPGVAQVAELHLRGELGLDGLDDVRVVAAQGREVRLDACGTPYLVEVEQSLGAPRRQSCADLRTKPAPVYEVVRWVHDRTHPQPTQEDVMTTTPEEPLSDDDMTTAPAGDPTVGLGGDADGTDGGDADGTDGGDADGTDGGDADGTDGGDADGTDGDGTDGDATDTTDGDGSDTDGTDGGGTDGDAS